MSVFYNDPCHGTDGHSPIADSPSPGSTGAIYTALTTDDNLRIKSNRYQLDSAAAGLRGGIASGVPGSPNYTVTMQQRVIDTSDTTIPRVYGHLDPSTGNGYVAAFNFAFMQIFKLTAWTETEMDAQFAPGPTNYVNGALNQLDLVLVTSGSTVALKGYWNGGLTINIVDSSGAYSGAGKVAWGLSGYGSPTTGAHIESLSGTDDTVAPTGPIAVFKTLRAGRLLSGGRR